MSALQRASGYRPCRPAPSARTFARKKGKNPPAVDLRKGCSPVEDQGELSSCTANGVVGIYEFAARKGGKKHTDLSRLFVYYNARARSGDTDEDAGSVIQYAMEVIRSR